MDPYPYPGKGLSVLQLTFALNEELRRVACSPGFNLEAVSRIDQELLTALAAVREWKNTFVPINCIPSDILSLIPTHLSSQKDRFRTSFVCRHWRRSLIQNGALWTQLFLRNGAEYVTTLLKRAKGSALDIVTVSTTPIHAITQLSPHARQIRRLKFAINQWPDVAMFSEVDSGPLPLLRTLKIRVIYNGRDSALPPLPLFSGALNLQRLVLYSKIPEAPPLTHFVFPNITVFELTILQDRFDVSDLLSFFKTSPLLQTVEVDINAEIMLESVPLGTVVVLPNAKAFSLSLRGDTVSHIYDIAPHISCPRVRHTSLAYDITGTNMADNLEIFPTSSSWDPIIRHYTTNPIEEVVLEWRDGHPVTFIAYTLTFRSSDTTVVTLDFGVTNTIPEEERSTYYFRRANLLTFHQACRTIQDHPQLSRVKRFHIKGIIGDNYSRSMANAMGGLFRSLGPLDELYIRNCSLGIFLTLFIGPTESQHYEHVFPPIKRFIVWDPWMYHDWGYTDAIVGLAKSQYESRKPFKCVVVCARWIPTDMAGRLREWVNAVDCSTP